MAKAIVENELLNSLRFKHRILSVERDERGLLIQTAVGDLYRFRRVWPIKIIGAIQGFAEWLLGFYYVGYDLEKH